MAELVKDQMLEDEMAKDEMVEDEVDINLSPVYLASSKSNLRNPGRHHQSQNGVNLVQSLLSRSKLGIKL